MPRRSIGAKIAEEPLDLLEQQPSRAKRARPWEERQRAEGKVATYRGIPEELQEQVKAAAAELGVTVGDLVRLALERFIADFDKGYRPDVATAQYRRVIKREP